MIRPIGVSAARPGGLRTANLDGRLLSAPD